MLWLGDNVANAYYAMNEHEHAKTFTEVTRKIQARFNKLGDVYPVMGNHEGLPRDHMKMTEKDAHWPQEVLAERFLLCPVDIYR